MDSRRRAMIDLGLVLATGLGQLVFESLLDLKGPYFIAAGVVWAVWIVWRLKGSQEGFRRWGFRLDNLGDAAKALTLLTVIAGASLAGLGFVLGHWPPPESMLLVLAIYPIWGLAQQFLLCAVLLTSARELMPLPTAIFFAGTCFAVAHAPDWPLVALTFGAGLMWATTFSRWPNLWAHGLAHGVLGTLAFVFALGRDPMIEVAKVLETFG